MTVSVSKFLSVCLMMALTFFLFGCERPRNQSELYGVYVADYKVAREKLTLNKDGTFVQEVILKATGKVDVAKGTWTYNPQDGYVTFDENFMVVLDGFRQLRPDYTQPTPGLVDYPAVIYLGRMEIDFHEGLSYKKVKDK